MQKLGPSLEAMLQAVDEQPVQLAVPVHGRAQVPLGRQVCPLGQGQVTV
jgi:hypothetical protein